MWLRFAKYWPDSDDDITFPYLYEKPKKLTFPPPNGTSGSSVPFMIMTEEVPVGAGLHLKLPGVGTWADTAATARNVEGAPSARRNAMKPPREVPAAKARPGSISISVAS